LLNHRWRRVPPVSVSAALIARSLGALALSTEPTKSSSAGAARAAAHQDLGELMAMLPTSRPEGLDSSDMTPEERQAAAERLMFGQRIRTRGTP
jgi:hypothetical protein